ncbi:hypothetical protein KR067_008837, partial [Drosophila pandora]
YYQVLELFFFFVFQVVISGALCTVEDYVIMSLCAQDKAIHLAAEGTVSVTDTSQIQNITILGFPDYLNQEFTFKLALYAKETQRYLCFNDNWRLVGMTKLRDTCYFNETIHHGYFVFRSIVDSERRVGFTHGGKPVGPKMSVKDACYHFNKIDVETFYRQHRHLKINSNSNGSGSGSGSGNSNSNGSSNSNIKSRKPPRNNKNNRHKSNNQNQKLQQQQEHHGHNNNNVILNNNSSTSLSRTNKKQQSKQQQQQQQQHQVRHHHNDPSLLARRQQHERKQKRRKQQKQQQQQHQQQQQQQRVTASPTKPATATTPVATSPATATTAATLSSKRKGRRRKGKSRQPKLQRQQQQQLAPAATATTAYTDDSFYSSSSIGSSTGFEDLDPYNVSSSSSTSLDPWSTWSTIDSFSSSSNSGSSSSSSTTTTSDDSISSSSNYDLWATMITKMEAEASETTSELSGNDTDLLLQYEPQMVEDTGMQEEAESTATYETKATSAIAATAATTTSTTGQQLVIEQTPLQQEMARRISTPAATATATATSTSAATARATTTPTATTSQTETTQSTQNQGQNEVKPPQRQHKFLASRQHTATTRVSSTAETLATTPRQQRKQPSSLFSIHKNINSDLNNSLTEASPTATATTGATATVTAATTTKKSLRKFTRKLMATPYHQLTYVRNEAGDIDIDNLDNISVYPDLYEGDLEGNGNGNGNDGSNSTDINRQMPVSLSGYLPTTTTSVLTEFIRIGKNKIDRALKRSQMQKHRRFA